MAVAFVVHGPNVVAQAREVIHHRVVVAIGHLQVEHRLARVRRAMHAEKTPPALHAALALAIDPELHAVLVGPVFVRDDRSGLRRRGLGQRNRGRSREGEPCEQGIATIGHFYSPAWRCGTASASAATGVFTGPLPEYRSR